MALFLLRHCRNTGNLSENFSKYRLHAIQKEIRPRRPTDGNGFPSIQLPRNRFQIFLAFPAHNPVSYTHLDLAVCDNKEVGGTLISTGGGGESGVQDKRHFRVA